MNILISQYLIIILNKIYNNANNYKLVKTTHNTVTQFSTHNLDTNFEFRGTKTVFSTQLPTLNVLTKRKPTEKWWESTTHLFI